jgi:hypothetical protein
MAVSLNEKTRILEAYLHKRINKEEMKTLLRKGIIFPPIPWLSDDLDESQEEEKRRALICRVFDFPFLPKIEWI